MYVRILKSKSNLIYYVHMVMVRDYEGTKTNPGLGWSFRCQIGINQIKSNKKHLPPKIIMPSLCETKTMVLSLSQVSVLRVS